MLCKGAFDASRAVSYRDNSSVARERGGVNGPGCAVAVVGLAQNHGSVDYVREVAEPLQH